MNQHSRSKPSLKLIALLALVFVSWLWLWQYVSGLGYNITEVQIAATNAATDAASNAFSKFAPIVNVSYDKLISQIFSSSNKKHESNFNNIVFILTDDQDILMSGLNSFPKTMKLIEKLNNDKLGKYKNIQAIKFNNAFVNSPVCCVSRSTILTGRYPQNHGTLENNNGCNAEHWVEKMEPLTYANILNKKFNYTSMYAGKYLNVYPGKYRRENKNTSVPVGWDYWYGLCGNSIFYNYEVMNNEKKLRYGTNYSTDYLTDNIKREGMALLHNLTKNDQTEESPFIMVLSTPAAHQPFVPAPQYSGMFDDTNNSLYKVPRNIAFNVNYESNSRKASFLSKLQTLSQNEINLIDYMYRRRLECLYSVDDLIYDIFNQIEKMNLLSKTYFIFYSDHGYHLGQFGTLLDKRLLYETDIRVPMFIIGPNIDNHATSDMFVTGVDIAPTILDLAVGIENINNIDNNTLHNMDGFSIKPYITKKSVTYDKKQQFYVTYQGEPFSYNMYQVVKQVVYHEKEMPFEVRKLQTPENLKLWNFNDHTIVQGDSINNTYHCVRMINESMTNGVIYCSFECFIQERNLSKKKVKCDGDSIASNGEYYELDNDAWNYYNKWEQLSCKEKNYFENLIDLFHNCQGNDCNSLRFGKIDKAINTATYQYHKKSDFYGPAFHTIDNVC